MSGYSGNAGYDHWAHHNGMEFSTRDRDNDGHSGVSCSQTWKGGHWDNACYGVNPTGLYKNTGEDSMNLWYSGGRYVTSQMTLKIKSI